MTDENEVSFRDKEEREAMNRQVEAALYRRACGYDAEDTVTEESERGSKERISRYHIPGDVRAMIFWLQSQRPEAWKARPEPDAQSMEEKGVNIVDNIP